MTLVARRPSWQSRVLNCALRLGRRGMRSTEQILRLREATARSENSRRQQLAGQNPMKREQWDCGPVDWLSSAGGSADRVLLYLHGGAFCLHMPWTYGALVHGIARRIGADAVIPDYRLAPEYPHPAALEDCMACYRELLRRGYPAGRIAIAADSAGGLLALSTLALARQQGLPMPACMALISTAGDWSMSSDSFFRNAGRDAMLDLESLMYFRHIYLAGASPENPLVSPLLGSFEGFPPMHLTASSDELMSDISIAAAERAQASGVQAELRLWPGMCHVFPLFSFLPESRRARAEIVRFINRHWPPVGPQ